MVGNVRTSATDNMRVEFFGVTAHAGNSPWLGRSAVDACELFAHGLNLMREHIEPTARLHYVYESAGTAPNVVPDYARMWVTSRDIDRARVMKTSEWIRQIAEGAAQATQTTAKVDIYYGMADLVPNTPLAERMQSILQRIGAPSWSEADQEFARALQAAFGVPEKGLETGVSPLPTEPALGGSTDVGDVSYQTPTMGLSMPTLPIGISLHTWAATASHGMDTGLKAGRQTALAMALLGWDILTDADLRAAARADLVRRTADKPYQCALPADRTVPFDMPKWMIPTDGSREMLQ